MFVNSLDSDVWDFLVETEKHIQNARSTWKLNEPVLKGQTTTEIAKEAIELHKENVESARYKSQFAPISGVLSATFILSGLILNYARTKGKIVKSPLLSLACFVAGFVLTIFWVLYRNYPARLAKNAFNALEMKNDDKAVRLVGQGAVLSIEKSLELSAKQGCIKTFLYLVLLGIESERSLLVKKKMIAIFHDQDYIDVGIRKIISDLVGVFDIDHLADLEKTTIALSLGVAPHNILSFANSKEVASLARAAGAKATPSMEMYQRFYKACTHGEEDDAIITYLIEQGSTAAEFGIQDYEAWEQDLSALEKNTLSEDRRKAYKMNQLDEKAPFERYIQSYHVHSSCNGPIKAKEFIEILKTFKVYRPDIFVRKIAKDSETLWKELNSLGLRIRKADCEKLFKRLNKPEKKIPKKN